MMKKNVVLVFISIVFLYLFSCSNKDYENKFLPLYGNHFLLAVNRISERPNVQYPSDQLNDDDYEFINQGMEYEIYFSKDLQTISIMKDSISGTMMESTEEYKKYDLDNGLFAGGRFVVWISNNQFEAEYTIYGSGIPILRSERGVLN